MEMSDSTPRTESARQQYYRDVYENTKGFCVAEPVHADFARQLERELDEANARLQNTPALLENNAKLGRKLAEANKYWARLDWLLSNQSGYSINGLGTREAIDAAMEEQNK